MAAQVSDRFKHQGLRPAILSNMYDELHAITDQHGIFLRKDAITLGYNDRDLQRSMRSGQIHRIRHGAYIMGNHWLGLHPEAQHLLLARAA